MVFGLARNGREFMQTQPKYQSEVTTVVMGERTITIKNLTPILPPKEREKRINVFAGVPFILVFFRLTAF